MLLKIIAVSENAPGAHRDVPRFSKVPRCGNTSRADGGSTVHPPGTAPAGSPPASGASTPLPAPPVPTPSTMQPRPTSPAIASAPKTYSWATPPTAPSSSPKEANNPLLTFMSTASFIVQVFSLSGTLSGPRTRRLRGGTLSLRCPREPSGKTDSSSW